MRPGLAAFADKQGWVLTDAGEDEVGKCFTWAATLV